MVSDTRADTDDPRAKLHRAIATAYHASQALLHVQARYGKDSPEVTAAAEQVQQAKAHLLQCERAYLTDITVPLPRRRRRNRTTDPHVTAV